MSTSRTARRLVATVLASGALLAAAVLPAAADDGHHNRHQQAERSSVALGHIKYNVQGRDQRDLNAEWVEVKNTGRHSVNLRGWTLSDREGNRYRFKNLRLQGHSTVRVHTGFGHDSRRDVYQDRRHEVWDNSDTATLRNDRGRVVDTESWGRRHHR
jgi:hypothetical protein